jgi:Zn-finger nucleic acid-binding protein
MIRCEHCSAPLPGMSSTCAYCGGSNDVDRGALARARASDRAERYPCPACAATMEPLQSGSGDAGFVLDRCPRCFGLFFPFYALEPALARAAEYGDLVDAQRLGELGRNAPVEAAVAYRKCPVCLKYMNRVNYGSRSGVITDQCHGHGIWLDAGEFKRLVEWKNAGGPILERERRAQLEREAERKRRRDAERLARWKRDAGPES